MPTLLELREKWIAPHEKRYLEAVLAECGGRVNAAAERAGVNRVTFYRLMKKHGVTLERGVWPAAAKA